MFGLHVRWVDGIHVAHVLAAACGVSAAESYPCQANLLLHGLPM
jgi:hypothetical protein